MAKSRVSAKIRAGNRDKSGDKSRAGKKGGERSVEKRRGMVVTDPMPSEDAKLIKRHAADMQRDHPKPFYGGRQSGGGGGGGF